MANNKTLLQGININENFWVINPEMKILFKDEYDWDLSEGKEDSSKILWAITLIFHPDSPYNEFSEKEIIPLVEDDFLGFPLDEELHGETIEKFKKGVLTKKQRLLYEWEKKFLERQDYIASLPYNQENADLLDKLMSSTKRIWDQYIAALADVEKEQEQMVRGGVQESAAEQGKI